eukprot:m.63743 g.63743  ORF g.63743 m.63743 type:complete len:351 (+) comp8086_c1_seq1:200-1252(+)
MEELKLLIVDKESDGELLVTYVYPNVSEETRSYVLSLLSEPSFQSLEFICGRQQDEFVYLKSLNTTPENASNQDEENQEENTDTASKKPFIAQTTLVLIQKEFFPKKYNDLCTILLNSYLEERNGPLLVQLCIQLTVRNKLGKEWAASAYSEDQLVEGIVFNELASKLEMRFIMLFSAIVLKKRVAIVASDPAEVLTLCNTIAALNPKNGNTAFNSIFPMINENNVSVLQSYSSYIAGFIDGNIVPMNAVDVLFDVEHNDIQILNNEEQFALGKFHKDVATQFLQDCNNGNDTLAVMNMLKERISVLESAVEACKDESGKVTIESLEDQKMGKAMKSFCYNYAVACGLAS